VGGTKKNSKIRKPGVDREKIRISSQYVISQEIKGRRKMRNWGGAKTRAHKSLMLGDQARDVKCQSGTKRGGGGSEKTRGVKKERAKVHGK